MCEYIYIFSDKFATLTKIEKIGFQLKSNILLGKTYIRPCLRNLITSIAFYGKLVTNWFRKIFKVGTVITIRTFSIGNNIKKT